MTNIYAPGCRSNLNLMLLTGMILLFFSVSLSAQSLPDFSGVWEQDIKKSDDFYKDFKVKSAIAQTKQTITITTTFADKDGKVIDVRKSTFTLDGKETTDKEGAKKSARWSADKKMLTTSDTRDYGGDLVGTTSTYSVSANGLVLTVKTSDIKPGVASIKMVFNKLK